MKETTMEQKHRQEAWERGIEQTGAQLYTLPPAASKPSREHTREQPDNRNAAERAVDEWVNAADERAQHVAFVAAATLECSVIYLAMMVFAPLYLACWLVHHASYVLNGRKYWGR